MACYHPLEGYRQIGGGITFDRTGCPGQSIPIKCGQCIGCKIDRTRSWAIRCLHEAQMHKNNSFITLTYNQASIPENHGLKKEHFKKFIARLRRINQCKTIRYYMCGEYGEKLGRPHYHAILFNHDFSDKTQWAKRKSNIVYRSAELERAWPYGHSEIGNVSFQSAAYVARYVMKKINGDRAEEHYQKVNTETGEFYQIEPEYNHMSTRPGIGYWWYQKYHTDVFPCDHVITPNGQKAAVPTYYDLLLKRQNQDLYKTVMEARTLKAIEEHKSKKLEHTPKRLKSKETCAQARVKSLKRPMQ